MITFLGYLSDANNTTPATKSRMLLGMDSETDAGDLPTTSGFVLPDGTATLPPAPWSVAVYPGGKKFLTSDIRWADLWFWWRVKPAE